METHDELNEGIEKAENWFRQVPDSTDEMVEALIVDGFLSYDDLTFLEPAQLAELASITEEQAEAMIAFAVNSVRWNGTLPYPPFASTPATFGFGKARYQD